MTEFSGALQLYNSSMENACGGQKSDQTTLVLNGMDGAHCEIGSL